MHANNTCQKILKTFRVVNNESVMLVFTPCTGLKVGKVDDKNNETGHIRFSIELAECYKGKKAKAWYLI